MPGQTECSREILYGSSGFSTDTAIFLVSSAISLSMAGCQMFDRESLGKPYE
jgi:hypothetical protein